MNVEIAEAQLRDVTAKYGTPVYIAHISGRVRRLVPIETRRDILATAHTSPGWEGVAREQGRERIMAYVRDPQNVYKDVSVKELAAIGGVSEAIARDVVKSNVRIFKPIEGRRYEIRDPKADAR